MDLLQQQELPRLDANMLILSERDGDEAACCSESDMNLTSVGDVGVLDDLTACVSAVFSLMIWTEMLLRSTDLW